MSWDKAASNVSNKSDFFFYVYAKNLQTKEDNNSMHKQWNGLWDVNFHSFKLHLSEWF